MAKKDLVINTPRGLAFQSKNGKVTVKFNSGFGSRMTEAMQSTQQQFSEECLRLCDKYIPKDTGMLIASGQLYSKPEDGLLHWQTPYARAMYYNHDGKTYTGPNAAQKAKVNNLRGGHWGERMVGDNKDHLKAFLKSRMRAKMK